MNVNKKECTSMKGRDNKKETKPEPSSWGKLPTMALIGIYQYLGDLDRVSLALVCKHFLEVFRAPSLWRTRFIELGKRKNEQEMSMEALFKSETALPLSSGKSATRLTRILCSCLQYLDICVKESLLNYKEILSALQKVSGNFDDANLQHLRITFSSVSFLERQRLKNLIKPLNTLICHQHNLKNFGLYSTCLDLEDGLQFLNGLAEASGKTIEKLSLCGVFRNGIRFYQGLSVEMQKFTNIRSILIDYAMLSDELVEIWAQGYLTLAYIKLWAVENDFAVSDQAWENLMTSHPSLLVEIYVHSFENTEAMLPFLSPAMPVFKLIWESEHGVTSALQVKSLLHRVADYRRTIKYLFVKIAGKCEHPDSLSVESILSNCRKLQPFTCKNFSHSTSESNTWMLAQDNDSYSVRAERTCRVQNIHLKESQITNTLSKPTGFITLMLDENASDDRGGPNPSQTTSCAKEARGQSPSWSHLPANALRRIYQGLSDGDRAKVARVSKSWSKGFRDPELWRSRAVEFGRKPEHIFLFEELVNEYTGLTLMKGQKAIKFAQHFPTCLEDMYILFQKISPHSSDRIVNDFSVFSTKFDQANLRKLSICHAKLYSFQEQKRKHLTDSLIRLIKYQRNLQTFRVESIYFDLENGMKFLKRLTNRSGATIETLYLKGFFLKKMPFYQERRVITEMEKFTRLSNIHMDYSMISEQLVELWGRGCPTLAYVTLGAKKFVARENVVSCEAWKALLSTHPNLLFELHFKKIQSTRQMLPLLAPCLPMFKLNWEAMDVVTPERDLKSLLNRVACYGATIKYIFLMFHGEFPNIDTISTRKILSNCKRLRPFVCDHIRIVQWMSIRHDHTERESEMDWDNWHFRGQITHN